MPFVLTGNYDMCPARQECLQVPSPRQGEDTHTSTSEGPARDAKGDLEVRCDRMILHCQIRKKHGLTKMTELGHSHSVILTCECSESEQMS